MIALVQGNALNIPLPDGSVHCCVTSPPYWGLRKYADVEPTPWPDGWLGCLGLEPTPEMYVEHLVAIFREVRRVLRDDGVCWVNLGDSYVAQQGQRKSTDKAGDKQATNVGSVGCPSRSVVNLKPLDLIGIPWRVAFALQADDWYLRSDVIWAKGVSFCDSYSGSCMPESVNGWRWERHQVKVAPGRPAANQAHLPDDGQRPGGNRGNQWGDVGNQPNATWADCPGCPKCDPHDGYVLRRGSWRPTKGHECVFLLAKSADYFCDGEAVREPPADYTRQGGTAPYTADGFVTHGIGSNSLHQMSESGRNPRTVWAINPQPYSGAHYATFPPALVEPCIKAGTSEAGCCPRCGAPWARVMERTVATSKKCPKTDGLYNAQGGSGEKITGTIGMSGGGRIDGTSCTTAWRPTCDCPPADPIPCTVLDPFAGSGTTLVVARDLGRDAVGLDLSSVYLRDNAMGRLGLDALAAWEVGEAIDGEGEGLDALPLFAYAEGGGR